MGRPRTLVRFGLAMVALALSAAVDAKDMRSLYPRNVLEHWQGRYDEGIRWNLENVVWPRLTPDERAGLTGATLDLPLYGPQGDPFTYFATLDPKRVAMPVLSLKFFDDMSIAIAWLWRHGNSLETAFDYVAMLKYRSAEQLGGRYPPPLPTLHAPDNVLEDPAVDDLAQKIFKSAVIYVLLHELGHIYYRHPGYDGVAAAEARGNEEQADAFALEVMRRIGAQPTGILFFFQTLAYGTPNRGDFDSQAAYEAAQSSATHPLTENRMRRIAETLRAHAADYSQEYADPAAGAASVRQIAEWIDNVADILGEPDLQRLIAERGRGTSVAGLVPRRPGETLGVASGTPAQDGVAAQAFHGVFDGEISEGTASLPIRTLLQRQGDRVTGQYSYGRGEGTLLGFVEGDRLTFEWREGGSTGMGSFVVSDDGTFTGTWGYGRDAAGAGSWTGQR